MNTDQRRRAAIMGALVADAATLGAHWIYDVGRIAQLRADHGGSAAFLPVRAAHFAGKGNYFVHGARASGMNTQYGAVTALALASVQRQGGFDPATYQAEYAAFFGAGGGYAGYIDRPTRGTLANLAAGKTDPSGIDDDQLPAIATLPVVVAAHFGADDLAARVQAAISVTNVNPIARAQGAVFADLLAAVIGGAPLCEALRTAAHGHKDLLAALDTPEADSTVFGGVTGRACHLPMAMPLAFHIMARATDYADAVERNIAAGGDNAGRAILIGAVMGAVHGIATDEGVPLEWLLQLQGAAALWDNARAISG